LEENSEMEAECRLAFGQGANSSFDESAGFQTCALDVGFLARGYTTTMDGGFA
jgi:hypothetical protein